MEDLVKPKLKVIKMQPKQADSEEDVPYVSAEIAPLFEYLGNFIEKYGCSEMQIIVLDGDMNAEIIGTIDRSTTMLGALNQAIYRYTSELKNALADLAKAQKEMLGRGVSLKDVAESTIVNAEYKEVE